MQALQQFVNQSPWDWQLIRESLARDVTMGLQPRAWVFQKVILPKRGSHSVGVARRFVPSVGRTINCQLGIGAFLAGDRRSVPVDWRLVLDGPWLRDVARRQRTKVPEMATETSLSAHVLGMVDTLAQEWRLPPAPVVADATSTAQEARSLARGLSERQVDFLLEISGSTEVTEAPQLSTLRPATPRGAAYSRAGRALTAQECLTRAALGRPQLITVGGDRGRASSLHVVPAPVSLPDAPETYRLFTYRSPAAPQETKVWLTNIVDRRLERVIGLILTQSRSEQDLGALEEHYGIRDFEGRSYPGWHHHMTLVSAAYAFDVLDRDRVDSVLRYTG